MASADRLDRLDAAARPRGDVVETVRLLERGEAAVAGEDVEPAVPLELPEAHGAELERAPVRLLERVRSAHPALEERAVLHPEHVPELVRHDLEAPQQRQLPRRLGVRLAPE